MKRELKWVSTAGFLLAGMMVALPAIAGPSERRISIDLVGVPAEQFFRSLADELGATLNYAPELVGTVSLRLDGVRITTALDAACDSLGCTWVVVEGDAPRLKVIPSRTEEARGRGQVTDSLVTDRTLQPVTLSLKDAKLGDVMGTFAKILRCDLEMKANPELTVTAELQNVTAMEALDKIGESTSTQSSIHWGPLMDQCRIRVESPRN